MSLLCYEGSTVEPQLNACKGVDTVVDAAVIGNITAGEAAVGSVYDGVTAERGDISLPEIDVVLDRGQTGKVCNPLLCGLLL